MGVKEFLSEDEGIVAKMGDFHLTNDRIIHYEENGKNKDYKDIQLDKLDSFSHTRRFDYRLALSGVLLTVGGLSLSQVESGLIGINAVIPISILGILMVLYAYLNVKEEYEIRSSGGTSLSLEASNTPKFWKKINKQKNGI